MTAKLRPALAALPAYVPGRTVPGSIKLASNETPYPPLPHVIERIAEAAAGINRYPDNASAELTAAPCLLTPVRRGRPVVLDRSVAPGT